jgi:hypothetical protein
VYAKQVTALAKAVEADDYVFTMRYLDPDTGDLLNEVEPNPALLRCS